MFRTKMISLFMAMMTIAQILFFTSCKNDGWELVSSITITTDGKTKTFRSQIVHDFNEPSSITKEEYEQIPLNIKLSDFSFDFPNEKSKCKSFAEIAKISKGSTTYSYKENNFEGEWYYWTSRYETPYKREYYKKRYVNSTYYLVYVKVVNDSTIKIKTNQGETTYTVTSYTIKN